MIKNEPLKFKSIEHQTASGMLVFCFASWNDAWDPSLGNHFYNDIKTATLKRQQEYVAARLAAVRALEKLGYRSEPKLSKEENGVVQFPEGFEGSLSHIGGLSVALVGRGKNFHTVGVDIELKKSRAHWQKLTNRILSPSEQVFCRNQPFPFSDEETFSLIFSAKETVFKTLFPLVKKFFGFSAAEIVRFEARQNELHFELKQDLNSQWKKGKLIQVHFSEFETAFYTFSWIPQKT